MDNFYCLRHLRDDIYQELQTETIFFHKTSQKAGKRKNVDIMAVAYLMPLYLVYCLI